MELRAFKFRLYPTKNQQSLLNSHFFASNQAWNHALALKKLDLSQNAETTRWTERSVKSSQVSMESLDSILLDAEMHQLEAPSFRAGDSQGFYPD